MARNEVKLDPAQQAIVDLLSPAAVVRAAPGTGKTEIVAQRVERLLALPGDPTSRLACLSYTNKAANELRERFRARLGDASHRAETATIHAFAHDLIRQHGTWIGLPLEPEILSAPGDRLQLLLDHFAAAGQFLDESEGRVRLGDIDRLRSQGSESHPTEGQRELLDAWEAALEDAGALDFGSLVPKAIEVLELPAVHRQVTERYGHIIVDEAQNLTPIQYELLVKLVGPPPIASPTLIMLGDPDQGIVEFAGANPQLMLDFAREYDADVITLDRNYRSAETIVALGQAVKAELGDGTPTRALGYPASGDVSIKEYADAQREAHGVADWIEMLLAEGLPPSLLAPNEDPSLRAEDIAVVGRSVAALRPTAEALAMNNIRAALAIRPEDWLATDLGEIAIAATELAAGSTIGPQRILRQILGLTTNVASVDDLGAHLSKRDDPLGALAPLVGEMEEQTPTDFLQALAEISVESTSPDDDHNANPSRAQVSSWLEDLREIRLAWESFIASTRPTDRTWPSWSVFVSRHRQGQDLTEGVRLLTVHKSQGREYRAVAIIALNDGQFPDFRATTASAHRAELRTFYVAVSRPTRALLLARHAVRETSYGPRQTATSEFLEMAKPFATNRLA